MRLDLSWRGQRGGRIGCAPNIHVSLVMLPEECASLSSRTYRWQGLKHRVIKRVLAAQVSRRLARYEGNWATGEVGK